ncbi:MAG: hypothetical protein GY801_24860 [bacterium]|nr:hypothetical protein [bacterium]
MNIFKGIFVTDIDGTAIFSKESYAQTVKEQAQNQGLSVGFDTVMGNILRDKQGTAENLHTRYPQLSIEQWLHILDTGEECALQQIQVQSGLYDFYMFLGEYLGEHPIQRFYIVSEAPASRGNAQIDHVVIYQNGGTCFHLSDFFLPNHRIWYGEARQFKPAPDGYLKARNRAVLELGADQVNYVLAAENSYRGVMAASHAGNIVWLIPCDSHRKPFHEMNPYIDYYGGYEAGLTYFSQPGHWPPMKHAHAVDMTHDNHSTTYAIPERAVSKSIPTILHLPMSAKDPTISIYHTKPRPALADIKKVSIISSPLYGDSIIMGGLLPIIFSEHDIDVAFWGPQELEHLLGDLPSITTYRVLPFSSKELNTPPNHELIQRFGHFYHLNRGAIDSSDAIIIPALMNNFTQYLAEHTETTIIVRFFGAYEPVSQPDHVITIVRHHRSLSRYRDHNIVPFAGFKEFQNIVNEYWDNPITEIAIPPPSKAVNTLVERAEGRDIIYIDPNASIPEKMLPLKTVLAIALDKRFPSDQYVFVIDGYDPHYRTALHQHLEHLDHIVSTPLSFEEKVRC